MSVTVQPARSLKAIQGMLNDGSLTCKELVQTYLSNIEEQKELNVFVEVYEQEALERAENLDQKAVADRGRLFGAVFSLKDVISYKGHALTAGSKILQGYEALYSATAVERLLAEAAIIIGRVNCDEFAMGSDNRTSYYGATHNGVDKTRVPGGSSGGSAVAVQMNLCLMSLGSDTGGSVRQPASFCGVVGFKPSYGRISRHGLIAYGSSFDQIGVIGNELEDVELVYQVMQGPDEFDGTLVSQVEESKKVASTGVRFAFIEEALDHPGLQSEIKDAFYGAKELLGEADHQVLPVSFNLFDYVIPAYYVLTSAEASSNLSRYDGIRYGFRSQNVSSLNEMYTHTRTEGFGAEVKRRILLGSFVLSVGYYDAYFAKAQKVRRLIKDQFEEWFTSYDAILIPTAPTTAWSLGDQISPVEMYLADIYSVLANLVGLPAVSVPLGTDSDGLPFGIQLLSARFEESALLKMAEEVKSVLQS